MVEGSVDVFVKEPKIGGPVVSEERARSNAVLQNDQR